MVGDCCENEVVGDEVAEGGAGGIWINGNPQNVQRRRDIGQAAPGDRIRNHIHHTGLIWKHGNPICLIAVDTSLIAHNSVHDSPAWESWPRRTAAGTSSSWTRSSRVDLEFRNIGGIYMYWPSNHPTPTSFTTTWSSAPSEWRTTKDGKIIRMHLGHISRRRDEQHHHAQRRRRGQRAGSVYFNSSKNVVREQHPGQRFPVAGRVPRLAEKATVHLPSQHGLPGGAPRPRFSPDGGRCGPSSIPLRSSSGTRACPYPS